MRFHGSVQVRAQADRNAPGTAIRFDPARNTFALGDYLRPQGSETAASLLATVGLEGRHRDGDLRWVVTADTGELRRERQHAVSAVCWSDTTPSGLARPGSRDCGLFRFGRAFRRVAVPVEETTLRGAQVTSNGRPFDEELRHTLLLREAYASYRFGRAGFLTLTVGRKRTIVGDGYIHDDYVTGVELDADVGAIGPQWDLGAALVLPTRGSLDEDTVSPMVVLRADYLFSLFDRAGLFVAGLRERGDGLGALYRGAMQERLVVVATENEPGTLPHRRAQQLLAASSAATFRSDGALGWVGTSGRLTPARGHRLAWTAALLGGRIRSVDVGLRQTLLAEDVTLRGHLVSLRWDVELARTLGAGASFLLLSGDELPRGTPDAGGGVTPARGTYRAFMGVSPYLTETAIFFGGGLSEGYADRQVRSPGVNGRGVVSPAVSLRWDPRQEVAARARAAWLGASADGPFGGRVYGTEVDFEVTWEATRWLLLGAEADVLFPGDVFRGRRPVTRGVLAVDLRTP